MPRGPRQPAKPRRTGQGADRATTDRGRRISAALAGQRLPLALVLAFFLATRLWLLWGFEPRMSDLFHLGVLARQGIDLGQVPYKEFDVEYPPLAWWLIASPRWLDSRAYPDESPSPRTMRVYFDGYLRSFRTEMLLADCVCLALMFVIGRQYSARASWVLPGAYALLTAMQPHLIHDRLDLALLVLFLGQMLCWLRSLAPSRWANAWATASYLVLGLGISFKIMPIIFVPFLLLADLYAAGGVKPFAGRVLALGIGTAVPFLVYVPTAGWDALKVLPMHAERGTNLGSFWSSITLVAAKFGLPCEPYYAYYGWNLVGPWSETIKRASSISLLAVPAAFGLWALARRRRFDRATALDTAILVLYNCTLLSHVFSPQYLNWMLPLALILAMNILPRSGLIWSLFGLLIFTVTALSSWLFPYNFRDFHLLDPLAVNIDLDFIACMSALGLLLNVAFFAHYGWLPGGNAPRVPRPARVKSSK